MNSSSHLCCSSDHRFFRSLNRTRGNDAFGGTTFTAFYSVKDWTAASNPCTFCSGGCYTGWPMTVLMLALMAMHIYWYYLFLRILDGIVRFGSPHAAGQQEYEGASDDESTPISPTRSSGRKKNE